MNPLISVVIVTRNRKDDLTEGLKAIKNSTYTNYEVIVIDNASSDDTATTVRKSFPEVKLVRSERNLGGAGGRNLGIKKARGNYIFFADDDAVVDKDVLSESLIIIQSNPKIGVVQPKICDYKDRETDYGIGHGISLKTGRVYGIDTEDAATKHFGQAIEIPMTACCWMIKREVLEKVGLFDETFFIPYEDSDLSVRITKAGYKIMCAPKTRAWHKGIKDNTISQPIQKLGITTPSRGYYTGRNKIIFMRKHATLLDLVIFLIFWQPLYTIHHSLVFLFCRRLDILKSYWQGLASGMFTPVSRGGSRS